MKSAIDKYLKYLRIERNASPHTITSYENDLNQFLEFLSAHFGLENSEPDINSIERLTIRLWLGELSEESRHRVTARAAFRIVPYLSCFTVPVYA